MFSGALSKNKGPCQGEVTMETEVRGQSDRATSKGHKQPPRLRKAERVLHLLAPRGPFWTYNLQNRQVRNVCCFKPLQEEEMNTSVVTGGQRAQTPEAGGFQGM